MAIQPPGKTPSMPQPEESNLQPLRQQFANTLDRVTSELRLVKASPHLLDNESALGTIADALKELDAPSKQAANLGG